MSRTFSFEPSVLENDEFCRQQPDVFQLFLVRHDVSHIVEEDPRCVLNDDLLYLRIVLQKLFFVKLVGDFVYEFIDLRIAIEGVVITCSTRLDVN